MGPCVPHVQVAGSAQGMMAAAGEASQAPMLTRLGFFARRAGDKLCLQKQPQHAPKTSPDSSEMDQAQGREALMEA